MDKGLFEGINAKVLTQERMADHTTFRIGGPAKYFVTCFILGGGANVLFPDAGYDGIVIATEGLNQIFMETNGLLHAGCGAAISDVAGFASQAGRAGLQYFYSMPGSIGGAIYMNARCYNASISDVLKATVYLDGDGNICTLETAEGGFDYKKSPFQTNGGIILEGVFATSSGNAEALTPYRIPYANAGGGNCPKRHHISLSHIGCGRNSIERLACGKVFAIGGSQLAFGIYNFLALLNEEVHDIDCLVDGSAGIVAKVKNKSVHTLGT